MALARSEEAYRRGTTLGDFTGELPAVHDAGFGLRQRYFTATARTMRRGSVACSRWNVYAELSSTEATRLSGLRWDAMSLPEIPLIRTRSQRSKTKNGKSLFEGYHGI